jgi:hypothetical protein
MEEKQDDEKFKVEPYMKPVLESEITIDNIGSVKVWVIVSITLVVFLLICMYYFY